MKHLRPVFFFTAFILLVGMACAAVTGGDNTPPTQAQPPTQEPVQLLPTATEPAPEPTEPPATEAPPPTEEAPVASEFFTEEFDQDPGSNWSMDIIGPGAEDHADEVKTEFSNSGLRVELPEDNLYFYYTYLGYTYEDVRIDLRAENRGVNFNNVSLFCRASDEGWYEWSVRSDGLWDLWAVTDKYNHIFNGGTNALKQGKEVNEYAMVCKGDKISLFVNGQEIKGSPFTESRYGLRDGTVGFNISSLNRKIKPVIVEVDWFKVSEP